MGGHEEWPQLSGLLPNESASSIRVLDSERWSKAEDKIAELIGCIQPNQPSEERRNAVADYVQRLILKCFPCKVFTFGSVPLKTYLPDGDIDLTAFSKNQSLKDTWASQVRDILESEEKNENAEFHVKEVQYIQAEVKIIKCLVENIVVDISFNQLGGLCTLCFLEEVDHLINQDHLFKRSIILIKAWCYYESRILGAHHGLISTYALETLVLYIFHVFNNSFTGPLEVLYRFLEFFSNFDWDNFCVSLWGPVPIGSLPDGKAEPPRKDGGELLLSKLFLEACSSVYAVFPGGQENQGQPFISKHFNVIDPLREKNNLGRSVSKGNFYRIRSAFAFGAKRLARLVDCPEENIVFELNQFFMNTWERHGSGIRPDVPIIDSCPLSSINPDDRSNSQENASISNHANNNASSQENEIDVLHSTQTLSSQRASYPQESISKSNDVPAVSCMPGQKSFGNPRSSRNSEQAGKGHSVQSVQIDRNQRSLKPDHLVNEVQGKYLFARTRSSPELTDAYYDTSSRGRRNKPAESGRSQAASKMDSNRRKNVASETVSIQSTVSSSDDLSSERQSSSHQIVDAAADSNCVSNSVVDDSGTGIVSEDHSSVMGAQGMHQEEQDLVNMMASSSLHSFGGQVPMPLNMASNHLPLPISQSVLASMGYGQRNMAGMIPSNFPLIDPQWAANLQFQQGLISSPLTQYFPGVGLSTNSEDLSDQGDENFGSVEYWHERDVASSGGVHQNDASVETFYADDRQPSTSGNSSFVPSSRAASSESSLKAQARSSIELGTSMRDDCVETFQRHDNRLKDDDRVSSARFSSAPQGGSVRTKTSSESSWDGSSARVSKVAREKRGKKPGASAAVPPTFYGKDKDMHEHASADLDDETRDWNTMSTTGNESDDISTGSQHASTLHVHPRNHMPSFEVAQTSGSDSVIPMAPMLLGPSSRQRVVDNSGVVPFTFYPTGPPVPFFTMLHFPPEAGTSDSSGISLRGEENPENIESGRSISFSVGHDAPDVLNTYNSLRMTPTVASEEPKSDILNSDFASHWQNLQFGRFCQGPRLPAPVICPSPVVVPPMYLQGRFPWEGPGRPVAANGNLLSQLMSYGPRLVPVAPPQPASSRPPTAYPRYTEELPRYRGGTGTYLPNPKASVRERHSSGGRRNNYNYDRSDHGDREGNWNVAKARAAGRSHNRNQAEKSRIDRLPGNDGRADRPWSTYRPDQISSYQAQNGPSRPSSSQGSSANVAYGMYPMPGMNPGGVTSNGPVVMLYPYDHNSGYASPGEQLEFGSLGPMGVGTNEASPIDGTRLRRAFEDQRFHGSSGQQSSPDQPSSPHFQRRI